MNLTVVILTKNEELHIGRALASVEDIASRCFVVDSGSSDRTIEIARAAGAEILVHPFITQAQQFNWALTQLPPDTGWVLRLDADEIVSETLRRELHDKLPESTSGIKGIRVSRRMNFMGRPVNWGGLFPVRIIRAFRYGRGRCENRWMDEHIIVDGPIAEFSGEIIDDNLNSLTWWTEKHNAYASREVVDLLNLDHGFLPNKTLQDQDAGSQAGAKRWIKENLYARLPCGMRAFVYFLYRYVIRLGFCDGKEGAAFHVLQGFWYRYLVDAKLLEVKSHMARNGSDVVSAIKEVLGIDVQA